MHDCTLALQAGERVVLLVNNLGASTPLEMSCVAREAIAHLQGSLQVRKGRKGGAQDTV